MRFLTQAWVHFFLHPLVIFGIPILWLISVYALASYMTTRKAFNVKSYMQVYNVAQILLCGYMVYGLMPCINFPNLFGINTAFDVQGEWFVFVHYLSKFLDWFDTLWIILKKNRKQLSFLHVYHHATIPMVWGFLLHVGIGNGTIRYGAWINSLTHVIMYSHYLWTSLGWRNPYKGMITWWQIGQFYSCLLHAFAVRVLEETESWEYAWLQISYQVTMVYLFSRRLHWVPSCTPDLDNPEVSGEFYSSRRYILIRGQTYDVTNFAHPGGEHMLDLAIGRDATVMFESAHLRFDRVDTVLKSLPQGPTIDELQKMGYSFDRPVEQWSSPAESELYNVLRKRVLTEVVQSSNRTDGTSGARGVPDWHIACVLAGWLTTAVFFISRPSVFSGTLLGFGLVWVGLAIQHTANHGALVKNPRLGYLLGLLNDVGPGGSAIVWRYHHQCSHHAYCNDATLDQDVHSSFPLLRLDRHQKMESYHRWQWLYGPVTFCFLWFSIQVQDLQCLLDARSFLVRFKGTSALQVVIAIILKLIHVGWLWVLPAWIHGVRAMILPWATVMCVGSFWLASLFIVSHNTIATKRAEEPLRGVDSTSDGGDGGDWARYQIETSTSWGGAIGSFFTGGLNLQIEHHLFPCLAHHLYVDAQVIVKEECAKRNIAYVGYDSFLPNFLDLIRFLHAAGRLDNDFSFCAQKKIE